MVLSLPYLFYSYVGYSFPAFTGRKFTKIFIKPTWIWWTLKIILVYWILRNIPVPPFSWLAP
jgi:preprotein translocase subunit SecY